MDYLRLNLADQLPDLGCGHRSVLVVSLGPKWATLLEPASCSHATLEREDVIGPKGLKSHGYDSLARQGTALELDAERLVARLLKNAALYGRWDATVRDACVQLGADPTALPPLSADAAPDQMVGGTGEATPTTPQDGEGSGAFIRRLWLTGLHTPDAILGFVHAGFAGSKAKRSDVYWNYKKLLTDGAANVPPWPAK